MTDEQRRQFAQRRQQVQRKHVENDPKIRAMRRQRRRARFGAVLGSVFAFAVAMLLIKSFVLAMHGPREFARMVAPVLEGQTADSVPSRLLGPDPVSTEIAAMLQPLLPQRTTIATTTPRGAGDVDATPGLEPDPEL